MASFAESLDQQFKELTRMAHEFIRAARESDQALTPAMTTDVAAWVTRCGQLIGLLSPNTSEYYQQYARALRSRQFYRINRANYRHLCLIEGALVALYDDYRKGLLRNLTGALQTEIFADFLEQAQNWLAQGRNEAAAVLVGSVLESALLKIAAVMNVPHQTKAGLPMSTEELNDALLAQGIYDKLTHGQVRTWGEVHSKAVRGESADITRDQALMMLQFVQNFVASQLA